MSTGVESLRRGDSGPHEGRRRRRSHRVVGQVEWGSGGKVAQTQRGRVRHRIRRCIVISPGQWITISLNERQFGCDWLAGFGRAAASPLGLQIGAPAEVRAGVTGIRVVGKRVVMMEVEAENGGIWLLGEAGVSPVRHS